MSTRILLWPISHLHMKIWIEYVGYINKNKIGHVPLHPISEKSEGSKEINKINILFVF